MSSYIGVEPIWKVPTDIVAKSQRKVTPEDMQKLYDKTKTNKCMKCEPFNVNEKCENRNTTCGYSSKNPIVITCDNLKTFLLEKNKRYGNSAIEPIKVFSKNATKDGILQRIDDKLSRIKNSNELRKNDIVDLTGYLVLLCIERNWTEFKELID